MNINYSLTTKPTSETHSGAVYNRELSLAVTYSLTVCFTQYVEMPAVIFDGSMHVGLCTRHDSVIPLWSVEPVYCLQMVQFSDAC